MPPSKETFLPPDAKIDAQMKEFLARLEKWRKPDTVAPDKQFEQFINEHPDLLTHYVTIEGNPEKGIRGETTHLVKLLLDMANTPDPQPNTKEQAFSLPNEWAMAQLVRHKAVQEQGILVKAAVDPKLNAADGQGAKLSWEMLQYAFDNNNPKLVAEMIAAGVPLTHGPDSVVSILKKRHEEKVPDGGWSSLSNEFFDPIADALVERQKKEALARGKPASDGADYALLELAALRKQYPRFPRIIDLMDMGYPLGPAGDPKRSREIIERLRTDDIPKDWAEVLSRRLRKRIGDENPVKAAFFKSLRADDPDKAKFTVIYEAGGLPKSLLYLTEEKALAQAAVAMVEPKPEAMQIVPEDVIAHTAQPRDGNAAGKSAKDTVLGSILLRVKDQYDAKLQEPNADPNAVCAQMEAALKKDIEKLCKDNKLTDDVGMRSGDTPPDHRWKQILEAYEPFHIFSAMERIRGEYESMRVTEAQAAREKAAAKAKEAPAPGGAANSAKPTPDKKANVR